MIKYPFLKKIICFVCAIFFMLPPFSLLAQDTTPNVSVSGSDAEVILLPRIYASSANANVDERNFVVGSFSMRNSEDSSVGDIQYEIQILDPLPVVPEGQLVSDNSAIFDRIRSSDVFMLKANEFRVVPFSYQAPSGLSGSFRLRIQIVTANDRDLGWGDKDIKLNGTQSFITLEATGVNVDSTDPITKERKNQWSSLEGINVNPKQKISLSADLNNVGQKQISGKIDIKVKRFLYKDAETIKTTGEKISLEGGASKQIIIPITTQVNPGAYIVLVSILDNEGKKVSGVGEYRYVVRGQTASVASVQIKDFPKYQDSLAQIDFVVAGSADRVTPVKGFLEFILSDKNGQLGQGEKTFEIKNVFPAKGSAKIALTRPLCGTPEVTIIVKNTANVVLDTYKITVPNFANPTCQALAITKNMTAMNTILVLIVVVIVFVLYRLRKDSKKHK